MVCFNRSRYVIAQKDLEKWDRLIHKYHTYGVTQSTNEDGSYTTYDIQSCSESDYYNLLPVAPKTLDQKLNEIEKEYVSIVRNLYTSRKGCHYDIFMSCEFKKPITSQEMFNSVTSIEEVTKLYYLQGFGFVVGLEGGVTLTATPTKVSDDTTTQKFDLEDGFYPPFSVSERERQAFTAFEIAFAEWKKRGYKDELLAPITLDHVKRMDTYADSFDKWH